MNSKFRILCLICVAFPVLLTSCSDSVSPLRSPLSHKLDTLFSEYIRPHEPGYAVLIRKEGKTIFRDGYGLSQVELSVPITPETVFRIVDLTKQFTATAILMLEDQGALSLNDPITQYVPDYPVANDTIRIRHLLAHSSGIINFTSSEAWLKKRREDLSPRELIDTVKDEPMKFTPGSASSFNNTGYILLGLIAERAAGIPFEKFIEDHICAPLGLENTRFEHHEEIVPNRANGYLLTAGTVANAEYIGMRALYPGFGLLSTIDDLAVWYDAQVKGTLLSNKNHKRYLTPFELDDGSSTMFTGEGVVDSVRNRPAIIVRGYITGYSIASIRLVEEDILVIVLSNTFWREPDVTTLALRAAGIILEDPYPEWTENPQPIEVIDRYVGVYRINEKTVRYVTRQGNRLFTQRAGYRKLEPIPAGDGIFFYPNSLSYCEFVINDSDVVTHMLLHMADLHERAERTDEPLPIPPEPIEIELHEFERFIGEYELESGHRFTIFTDTNRELWEKRRMGLFDGVRFSIFKNTRRFMIQSEGYDPAEIYATSPTEFLLVTGDTIINFVLKNDGTVDHVLIKGSNGIETALPVSRT